MPQLIAAMSECASRGDDRKSPRAPVHEPGPKPPAGDPDRDRPPAGDPDRGGPPRGDPPRTPPEPGEEPPTIEDPRAPGRAPGKRIVSPPSRASR